MLSESAPGSGTLSGVGGEHGGVVDGGSGHNVVDVGCGCSFSEENVEMKVSMVSEVESSGAFMSRIEIGEFRRIYADGGAERCLITPTAAAMRRTSMARCSWWRRRVMPAVPDI